MRTFTAIFFALLSVQFVAAQDADVRLWVSRMGNQYLKAQLVRVEGGVAVLKDEYGRLSEVTLTDLSNEDREYAVKNAPEVMEELPPPDPSPDLADDAPSMEAADKPAKKIKLPKALRTLQRLLDARANREESEDGKTGYGSKPLFGDDSSVFIALSGDFLNDFIQVPIQENQNVSDVILGTPIEGTAAMAGVATLVLKPSPTHASVELVVSGKVDTQTVGQQMLLDVHSVGLTQFEARKGLQIGTRGIELFEASATARSELVDAAVSTQLPGRLGSLVGRIGGIVVEAQRPEIDRAASERAAFRAAKDLDTRIDSEVARLQEVLSEVAPGMAKGKPTIPIQFRTTSKVLGILIGDNEPEEWKQFGEPDASLDKDIMIVLPRKTVNTAKRMDMAMRLLSGSIEDQLGEMGMDTKKLTPTRESWSEDKEWLTLEWDVDGSIVELLSKDFIKSTMAALPPRAAVPSSPGPGVSDLNSGVPSWNQFPSRRRSARRPPSVFRPVQ